MMAWTDPFSTTRSRPLRICLPSTSTCRSLISSIGRILVEHHHCRSANTHFRTWAIISDDRLALRLCQVRIRGHRAVTAHVDHIFVRIVRNLPNLQRHVAVPCNSSQQECWYAAVADAKER